MTLSMYFMPSQISPVTLPLERLRGKMPDSLLVEDGEEAEGSESTSNHFADTPPTLEVSIILSLLMSVYCLSDFLTGTAG